MDLYILVLLSTSPEESAHAHAHQLILGLVKLEESSTVYTNIYQVRKGGAS
jgi:hypothetical protein